MKEMEVFFAREAINGSLALVIRYNLVKIQLDWHITLLTSFYVSFHGKNK